MSEYRVDRAGANDGEWRREGLGGREGEGAKAQRMTGTRGCHLRHHRERFPQPSFQLRLQTLNMKGSRGCKGDWKYCKKYLSVSRECSLFYNCKIFLIFLSVSSVNIGENVGEKRYWIYFSCLICGDSITSGCTSDYNSWCNLFMLGGGGISLGQGIQLSDNDNEPSINESS